MVGTTRGNRTVAATLGDVVSARLGDDPPVQIRFWDGSALGPSSGGSARIEVRAPVALGYMLWAPGELGLARAYVTGMLDIEGDIYAALAVRESLARGARRVRVHAGAREAVNFLRAVAELGALGAPPAAPKEEARLRGGRHSKARDAAAIAHHYDVSNEFYEMVLGETMTYSCAYFSAPGMSLDDAQRAKHDLICRKLGLAPGMRLLDVGCGWGTTVAFAAENYGVSAVGVTLSLAQASLARERIRDAGLERQVEIRLQDYRDVGDGPYDAICSIGMFEHVGLSRLHEYFAVLSRLLVPYGRLMNHGISRPGDLAAAAAAPPGAGAGRPTGPAHLPGIAHLPGVAHLPDAARLAAAEVLGLRGPRTRFPRNSFVNRYVFPDGELHEVGTVVSAIQAEGLEARDVESLREHYALTLRAWVANLEAGFERAVELVGAPRARIWRLYMAGSALRFEANRTSVHQVLAVRTDSSGRSGMPATRGELLARVTGPARLAAEGGARAGEELATNRAL